MTSIKSLAMIKRTLEKAFLCKSHFMIMIHSEWCLLLFTCLLWDEPAIYFEVRRGVSKNGKTKSRTRKEGEKISTQGSRGKRLCLTYFWDLYNGNVRKEILIFLILFE